MIRVVRRDMFEMGDGCMSRRAGACTGGEVGASSSGGKPRGQRALWIRCMA